MRTLGGLDLTAVISTKSLEAVGLREGGLATARIKAPWVTLDAGGIGDQPGAENRFRGVVERVTRGADAAEVVATLADGTRISATLGLDALAEMRFCQGDGVTVLVSAFSVIVSAG